MTRSLRSMLGATLLEVMLVLSIVGLIILMSVRYYQSATTSSQIQQAMGIVQAITAAADNIAANGTGYASATSANIAAIAGAGILKAPWGGGVTISNQGATGYTVSIASTPVAVCSSVAIKLKVNTKYTAVGSCSGGTISYTYNASS